MFIVLSHQTWVDNKVKVCVKVHRITGIVIAYDLSHDPVNHIRKMNGDSKQPCLTSVYTSNASITFPLWMIWYEASSYNYFMKFMKVGAIP